MKQEYIEAITNLLPRCDNVAILDLIRQLLVKAGAAA